MAPPQQSRETTPRDTAITYRDGPFTSMTAMTAWWRRPACLKD
jgi:hypothetical protein